MNARLGYIFCCIALVACSHPAAPVVAPSLYSAEYPTKEKDVPDSTFPCNELSGRYVLTFLPTYSCLAPKPNEYITIQYNADDSVDVILNDNPALHLQTITSVSCEFSFSLTSMSRCDGELIAEYSTYIIGHNPMLIDDSCGCDGQYVITFFRTGDVKWNVM